jgi:hypothetical protein
MTRRELVRAAIDHREAERTPYLIDFCQDAWETLLPRAGGRSQEAFIDNDVEDFAPVWWNWHDLADDWR